MKTIFFLAFGLSFIFASELNAQASFNLQNLTNCDVDVAIEIGEATDCPPGGLNTPCTFYNLTIPANSSLPLTSCGSTGIIYELCIVC